MVVIKIKDFRKIIYMYTYLYFNSFTNNTVPKRFCNNRQYSWQIENCY